MRTRLLKRSFVLAVSAALILAMVFCSCKNSQSITDSEAERLNELGEILVSDLKEYILRNREKADSLVEYGYIVSNKDSCAGADALARFYVEYDSGNDCEATIIFTESSFVVTRVIFSDGHGYYLRYEYNKSNKKDIEVTGKIIDAVDLKYIKNPPKWSMTLKLRNKEVASFILRNPTA